MTAPARAGLIALLFFAAAFAAYGPALRAGTIWDDDAYLTQNHVLREADGLRKIWFAPGSTDQYYPLVFTTFYLEYRLWGLDPAGYHAVNIALHALNAFLLFLLLRRLGGAGALLAGLLFALHPVHVESVAWITERKNVLSGAFYLASLLVLVRYAGDFRPDGARPAWPRARYLAALALFAAALLSKTVTASLPAAFLLLAWWKTGRISKENAVLSAPFFVLGAMGGVFTIIMEKEIVGAVGAAFDLSWADRIRIAGRALWFYLWKLAWPHPLIFNYPRWEIPMGAIHWVHPAAALALFALLLKKSASWGRAPAAAAAYFFVTLVPALGFFDVFPMQYSFVADHFQYLASAGPLALAAGGLARLGGRARLGEGARRTGASRWPLSALRAAAAVSLLLLAALTWRQSAIYKDEETLWRDTIRKNPGSVLANNNLGVVLLNRGDYGEAIPRFESVLAHEPRHESALSGLGAAYVKTGRAEKAIPLLRAAYEEEPRRVQTVAFLGEALWREGRTEDAVPVLRRAVELAPSFTYARLVLGNALAAAGTPEDALRELRTAADQWPGFPPAHLSLASAALAAGQSDEARERLAAALASPRLRAEDRIDAALLQIRLGDTAGAIASLDAAARERPEDPALRDAIAALRQGRSWPPGLKRALERRSWIGQTLP